MMNEPRSVRESCGLGAELLDAVEQLLLALPERLDLPGPGRLPLVLQPVDLPLDLRPLALEPQPFQGLSAGQRRRRRGELGRDPGDKSALYRV